MTLGRTVLEGYLSSPIAAFRPWFIEDRSPQKEFIKAAKDHRVRVFRGGNRSGKTTVGGFDVAMHLCGWHPFTRFPGQPVHWWASSFSFRDGIGAVLWPALKKFLPKSEVRSVNWAWKSEPETPTSLVMRNGSTITFKSVEQTRVKYQGAKLHGIWLDEEHPQDIVEECRARLLDLAGYLNVTLTPVRRERWVVLLEKEAATFSVQASTIDAARAGVVDLEATLQFASTLPERQRRVRIEGDHVALQGAVWPEFTRETHEATVKSGRLVLANGTDLCAWPAPDQWRRFAAIDFGYNNPTAIVLAVEDPFTDRLYVYMVYYSSGVRASEWGRRMARLLPRLSAQPWADHDSFARAEFEAEGMPTIPARKSDVSAGLEAVSRALMDRKDGVPGLIFVSDPESLDPYFGRTDTKVLQDEIDNYHYKAHVEGRPDPKDQPVKEGDHACDGLRYLVTGYEDVKGGPPLPPRTGDAPAIRADTAISLDWEDQPVNDYD